MEIEPLERLIELSLLYDFYGELLNKHQKQIFEDYILNNLSLSEIAQNQGISRQGVYDLVKRCSKQLEEYENKLKLIDKFEQTKEKIILIQRTAQQLKETKEIRLAERIEELAELVLKEL